MFRSLGAEEGNPIFKGLVQDYPVQAYFIKLFLAYTICMSIYYFWNSNKAKIKTKINVYLVLKGAVWFYIWVEL